MTRLEETIWATAYVATMCDHGRPLLDPSFNSVLDAIYNADRTVLTLRETTKQRERLHADDQLEHERTSRLVLLCRDPEPPPEE